MAKVSDGVRNEYKRILRNSRQIPDGRFVGNRYPWQCLAAVQELADFAFERQQAKKTGEDPVEVRILTATFPNYVFGQEHTCETFTKFLKCGGSLRVIVWSVSLGDHTHALLDLRTKFPRFEVRLSGTDNLGNTLHHFLVADKIAYRLESPHEPFPPHKFDDFTPEIPAKITFNDPPVAGQLAKFFDDIWNMIVQP